MPARFRSRFLGYTSGGTIKKYFWDTYDLGTDYGASGETGRETCDDTTDVYRADHPLTLIKKVAIPMTVNGTAAVGTSRSEYDNYKPQNRALWQYCPDPTSTPWSLIETKALAVLNPNRPILDLPLFLWELKDVLPALKKWGDNLLGSNGAGDLVGGQYLAFQFGWLPLMDDLHKILNLGKLLDAHLKRMQALKGDGTRIKRTVLNTDQLIAWWAYPLNTAHVFIPSPIWVGNEIVGEKRKAWVVANVKIDTSMFPTEDDFRNSVFDRALGIHSAALSYATIWEMMPWSWLVDYFTNIGTMLAARRGGFLFTIERTCLMCKTVVTSTLHESENPYGLSVIPGSLTTTIKQRVVLNRPLQASLVYGRVFTPHMLGILGSLFLTRKFTPLEW